MYSFSDCEDAAHFLYAVKPRSHSALGVVENRSHDTANSTADGLVISRRDGDLISTATQFRVDLPHRAIDKRMCSQNRRYKKSHLDKLSAGHLSRIITIVALTARCKSQEKGNPV